MLETSTISLNVIYFLIGWLPALPHNIVKFEIMENTGPAHLSICNTLEHNTM